MTPSTLPPWLKSSLVKGRSRQCGQLLLGHRDRKEACRACGALLPLSQWENAWAPVRGGTTAPGLPLFWPQPSIQLLVSLGNREGLAPGTSSESCRPPSPAPRGLKSDAREDFQALRLGERRDRGSVLSAFQGIRSLSPPSSLPHSPALSL